MQFYNILPSFTQSTLSESIIPLLHVSPFPTPSFFSSTFQLLMEFYNIEKHEGEPIFLATGEDNEQINKEADGKGK